MQRISINKIENLILLLCFICAGCGKTTTAEKGSAQSNILPTEISKIALEDSHTSDGCFSVSRYADGLHSLSSKITAVQLTTQFQLSSLLAIRPEFKSLIAYAIIQSAPSQLNNLSEFDGFTQSDCHTLTYNAADGTQENFIITNASPSSLSAESSSGKLLEYHWLSPQSIEIRTRYTVYDSPCTGNAGLLDYTKVIDWSSANANTIDLAQPGYTIQSDYLSLVASAAGYDADQLYEMIPDPDPTLPEHRVLIVEKLRELATQPILPELLSCGA